jgi:hypothetical protein
MEALHNFLGEAASRNQAVIVLAQIPTLTADTRRVHRFSSLGLPHTDFSRTQGWEPANLEIRKLVEQYKNSVFLDLSADKLFADAPFENGVLLYRDEHHLNEIGSRRYGEVASAHLAKLTSTMLDPHGEHSPSASPRP